MIKSIRPHTFHIPVMGTGFTIDTPLKVAKYGISSVISLVDDVLVEQMRKFYCQKEGLPYKEIRNDDPDSRALRFTAYLNLMDRLVQDQTAKLQSEPFLPGTDITRYFELLPKSPLKEDYLKMLRTAEPAEKMRLQNDLRKRAVPGSIDVNIMTKLDRAALKDGQPLGPEFSDAMSALRGYANSTLSSSIVFSAGLNARLYSYASQFADFLPQNGLPPKKSIILKVSDFRSAEIQGKFLAKRGLWVSEFRIESGLNCGGHAFANDGLLMGPILEEFKEKRSELTQKLREIYVKALHDRNVAQIPTSFYSRLTVQGGIGTAEEDRMIREYYEADGTGWGTPFLLVPEVCNVDEQHLKMLCEATEKDVYLSDGSPLNIPFWMLRDSESEKMRQKRIDAGRPGSPCVKGFLVTNTEFTKEPICHASRLYQKLKLAHLSEEDLTPEDKARLEETLIAKACICHDLAGSATVKYGIEPKATTTVCCGPGIIDFSKVVALEEMVGHIYGRLSLLANPKRKHMFIRELQLYVDYFRKEISRSSSKIFCITPKYLQEFKRNMLSGIKYYAAFAKVGAIEKKNEFLADLETISQEIELLYPTALPLVGVGA